MMRITPAAGQVNQNWVVATRDQTSGIETIRAHFSGHAYDPHAHDEVLVGYTEAGVQQFQCKNVLQTSVPGNAILIEPGAVHDGYAPEQCGFTYAMLYLPLTWINRTLDEMAVQRKEVWPIFAKTLIGNHDLVRAIQLAFGCLHDKNNRLATDEALAQLIRLLCASDIATPGRGITAPAPNICRVREALHARMPENVGLSELAELAGIDRHRLSREFKAAFGIAPHAYLLQVRLKTARRLLVDGVPPSVVAQDVGFADQSHLGRWFQKAYRLTPAAYQRMCSNVLDT